VERAAECSSNRVERAKCGVVLATTDRDNSQEPTRDRGECLAHMFVLNGRERRGAGTIGHRRCALLPTQLAQRVTLGRVDDRRRGLVNAIAPRVCLGKLGSMVLKSLGVQIARRADDPRAAGGALQ